MYLNKKYGVYRFFNIENFASWNFHRVKFCHRSEISPHGIFAALSFGAWYFRRVQFCHWKFSHRNFRRMTFSPHFFCHGIFLSFWEHFFSHNKGKIRPMTFSPRGNSSREVFFMFLLFDLWRFSLLNLKFFIGDQLRNLTGNGIEIEFYKIYC